MCDTTVDSPVCVKQNVIVIIQFLVPCSEEAASQLAKLRTLERKFALC